MATKQLVTDRPRLYPIEEMGRAPFVKYPQTVILHESFLWHKLETGELPVSMGTFLSKKTSKIICPFCQKGLLKLVSCLPLCQASPGFRIWEFFSQDLFIRLGDEVKYLCTEPGCKGEFWGQIYWVERNYVNKYLL